MQIRPQQEDRGAVHVANSRFIQLQDLERCAELAERGSERARVAIAAQIEQGVVVPKHVLHRAPVVQPHMRDADAGACMGRVTAGLPFGDIAGLVGNQRRAGIGVGGLHSDHTMHAAMLDVEARRQSPSCGRALRRILIDRRRDLGAPDRHARRSPTCRGDIAFANWPALLLVAVEQAGAAPTLDHTCELP